MSWNYKLSLQYEIGMGTKTKVSKSGMDDDDESCETSMYGPLSFDLASIIDCTMPRRYAFLASVVSDLCSISSEQRNDEESAFVEAAEKVLESWSKEDAERDALVEKIRGAK